MDKNEIAMELGRKQKRISFWRQNFPKATNNPEYLQRAEALINKLSLLLVKITTSESDQDQKAVLNEARSCERELNALYDYSRLRTSARA